METGAGSLGLLFLAVGHIFLNKIVELLFIIPLRHKMPRKFISKLLYPIVN